MIETLEILVASAIFLTIINAEIPFLYGKYNEGVDPLLFYAIIYKTKLYYGEGETKSNHSRLRKCS